MKIFVAVEPVDFRKGIDGLAQICRASIKQNPIEGALFVFRNRRKTAVRLLVYDGQGFWLCYKRLSTGKFKWWPRSKDASCMLRAHELAVLLNAGDPASTCAAPEWRSLSERI